MDNNESLKDNLKSESRWLRVAFMLLFFIAAKVAGFLFGLLVLVQIVFSFVSAKPNANLQSFSAQLARFIWQVLQFLSYNSDEKPYPFSDWPSE